MGKQATPSQPNFIEMLNRKVGEQLRAQRLGYLLGAGSSYLNGAGFPLAFQLWDMIKNRISDHDIRNNIQAKLDAGASGIEQALDLLDDGGAQDTPYRHIVTYALADIFMPIVPDLEHHKMFVQRIVARARPCVKVFSLNYDPLVERAAALMRVRVMDGFLGAENCFFEPAVFDERIGLIRGTHKGKQFQDTVKPIHLFKLHGSLGWYECPVNGIRRCGFSSAPPNEAKRLMIPPQRRKAGDTMLPPYSALWSAFRGALVQDANPLNRLVCIGYGFADEHVNTLIESALVRNDFTALIFAKDLTDQAWDRWSSKCNTVVVTEKRCALRGVTGPGHPVLWSFERLAKEV